MKDLDNTLNLAYMFSLYKCHMSYCKTVSTRYYGRIGIKTKVLKSMDTS